MENEETIRASSDENATPPTYRISTAEDAEFVRSIVFEAAPAYRRLPRRGASRWRHIVAALDLPLPQDPTIFDWTVASHELAHCAFLRMCEPSMWSFKKINDRLMSLSLRTRIDHEMRAVLAQHYLVERWTGVRVMSERKKLFFGATQCISVMMLERHYGGSIERAPEMARAVDAGGFGDEIRALLPNALRRLDRLRAAHDPREDAAVVAAMVDASRSKRSG